MEHLPNEYKNETYINLSRLNLTSLPDNMFDNEWMVQVLDLSFNQLISLPSSIGSLLYLRELWVNNNLLTSLPASMSNLTRLIRLQAGSNQLTQLYDFTPHTVINILDISFNQLVLLPQTINNLSFLTILLLQNNQLTELPSSLYNIKSLQVLNLCNNPLNVGEEMRQYFPILNEFWY